MTGWKRFLIAAAILLLSVSPSLGQQQPVYIFPSLQSNNTWIGTNTFTGPVTITTLSVTSVVPSSPGGATLGTSALPFSSVFVGNAATNNIQITGTATAARLFTLPDANSNPVQPSTSPANQFATGISAAGVINYAQPAFSNLSGTITLAQMANLGTTVTVLHGNAVGQPSFGAVVSADLNITATSCANQVVSAISSSAAGTCTTITSAFTSGTFPATAHALLSATHSDVTAAAPVRGGGIFAVGVTPTWQQVAHSAAVGGFFKWNGTDIVASTLAAAGVGSPTACSNQFVTGFTLNGDAVPTSTCTTAVLASTQFANQGTTVTVLHGNAAGSPSFGSVAPGDTTGTTGSGTTFVLQTSPTLITPNIGAATGTSLTTTGIVMSQANFAGNASGLQVQSANPGIALDATGQILDNKWWDFAVSGTTFLGRAVNDASTIASNWITVSRTGTTVTGVQIGTSVPFTVSGVDSTFSGFSMTGSSTTAPFRRGMTWATDPAGDVTMWFNSAQTGAGYFFKDAATGLIQTSITPSGLLPRKLDGIRVASQFAGADCGAKINAASTDLAGAGEIWVSNACGTTISTAVTQAATNQTIRFIQGGTWSVSALITLSQAGCIVGLPGGSTVKPVILQAAAASNLPVMVQFNTGQNCLIDMELDGNKANNATGGVAVKMTSNQRAEIRHNIIINFKSHGIWIIGTTINDSCCGKMEGNIILNNDGDGIFVQKTSDWFVQDANEFESNGLQQVAAPQIPTVNCTNATPTVCTWQTGPKWSTDSSLVNTHVLLNGVLNTVSSIGSTTSVTLAANQGVLTGVNLQWGSGVETQNANAWRVVGNDFGQNAAMGWDANNCDSTTNGSSNNLFQSNQFANLGPDILITGFDPVHAAYCGRFTNIIGNQFVGNTAAFPTGINYNSIQLQDGGAEVIADNLFQAQQGTSPARARGVLVFESVAGRDQNKTISANQFQGTFTAAPISCTTQNTGSSCRNFPVTARFGTTCTTPAGAGNTCQTTYSWPNGGFADNNYTAVCLGTDPGNGTGTISLLQGLQTASSITILLTSTGLANTYGGLNCMAFHD